MARVDEACLSPSEVRIEGYGWASHAYLGTALLIWLFQAVMIHQREGRGGNREEERRAAFSCVYSVLSVGLSALF